MAQTKSLVIVESPAKAKTIAGYLGEGFFVESSIGHIRDLPRSASDIPPRYKKAKWAKLGVDVENEFAPLYIISPDKKAQVAKLKELLKEVDQLYLATDEDREGESIAWHLTEVLKPKIPVRRMVFHEITKKAIQKAIDAPREIDRRLVDAQEARRILDRLYGYEVSPVLWKKVRPKLSAGRVQSVATRILVERERERIAFVSAEHWGLNVDLKKEDAAAKEAFETSLLAVDGERLATGKDFDDKGKLRKKALILDGRGAEALVDGLKGSRFEVKSVERKPYKRSPAAPFMTSTLQQEAGRKLRFTARRTMQVAQRLYENGYITYMRTDSVTLSDTALNAARGQIKELYGDSYLPKSPRLYANRSKNAQEAHEAIRPAGERFRTPDAVAREVGKDGARLYELIWKRTIASQMADARGETLQVRIEAETADKKKVELSTTGRTILFPGFLRAYVEGSDDPEAELEERERHLPPLKEGETLAAHAFHPKERHTQSPARFTEAALVRRLEELGVGRPSTYASILSTIQGRGYVHKKGTALVPSFTAFAVVSLLEQHFPRLVDYAFTARMEGALDAIASGEEEPVPWLNRFYFGEEDSAGLRSMVSDQLAEIDARAINSIPIGEDKEGQPIVVRVGRFGPYLQRGEDTSSIPDETPPDELTVSMALELLAKPSSDRVLGKDPESGLPIIAREGRYGAYVQLGEGGADKKEKPKTASLLRSMTLSGVTLEDALKVLSLPREIGKDPADGEMITAQNGRYGPYLLKGKDSRNLEDEEQLFTVDLDKALELFKQPRQRKRRSNEPLRTLGEDPVSGSEIKVFDGRWGPYVSDGETMASLRKGDSIEEITTERAAELIQLRRERGPSKKRAKKKATKKAAKTATAKKAAKKSTAKKATKKSTAKKATKKKATKKKATKKKAAKKKGAKKGAAENKA